MGTIFPTFCVVHSGPYRGDLASINFDVSRERSIGLRVRLKVDIAVDTAGHDVDDRDVGHRHDIAICLRERFYVQHNHYGDVEHDGASAHLTIVQQRSTFYLI